MDLTKEEEIFKRRLNELANTAYNRGICTYSDFMGLHELTLFYSNLKELSFINHALWGGYEEAERRVVCFYEDNSFPNIAYPVTCLKIAPLNEKFSDRLTHRDYLGAILNLGIDRSKIGDIVLDGSLAYVFCRTDMAAFLMGELTRIKHTSVMITEAPEENVSLHLERREVNPTVASIRLDALLSTAFKGSRSGLSGLISGGKVFVNGRLVTSNSFVPKAGDIISVRGMGRFQYMGSTGQTKKEKNKITLLLY